MTDPSLAYHSGTADLDDDEFMVAFETPTLPNDRFRHYDHVRLAWIYLRQGSREAATERMVAAIRRFALHHHGDLSKYHDTITRAFMRLVAAHIALRPARDFPSFAAANPELFDKRLLFVYYSEHQLMSAAARSAWIAPDLRRLP